MEGQRRRSAQFRGPGDAGGLPDPVDGQQYFWQKRNEHTLNVKFVKLKKNWGWAGAINRAYDIRNPDSKYLALTHNDVVPNPDYLTKAVSFMEKHKDVGAVQGIVVNFGAKSIVDSSGFMMNEALLVSSPFNGGSVEKIRSKPWSVSMVEGTMPVYSLDALKSALGDGGELFVTAGFMYYLEDAFTSLRLWAHGYKCVVLPFVAGAHYRMGTSKKAAKKQDLFYYLLRNRIALLYMTNSAGKFGFITQNLRKLVISNRTLAERQAILISLIDGIRLGRQLKRHYGSINIYAAPLIRLPLKTRLIRWMH
jgi:GT2 family glycosyltransferase